jgi:membrane-associated phospholipid phosphatase
MPKPNTFTRQSVNFLKWYLPIVLAAVVVSFFYTQLEISLLINGNNSLWLDFLMYYITYLGDGIFAVILAFVIFYFNKIHGVTLLIGYASSALFAQLLKRVVFLGFNRPAYFLDNAGEIHLVLQTEIHYHNSFPSGHATTAFVLAAMLSLMYNRSLFWILLAALVAYSRVYLFQHFLRDVIFGSLIGVLFGFIVYHYFCERNKAQNIIEFFTKKHG